MLLLLTLFACGLRDGTPNKDRSPDDSTLTDDSAISGDSGDDSHPPDDSTPPDDSGDDSTPPDDSGDDSGGDSGDDTGPEPQPPTTGFAATAATWDVPNDLMGGPGFYTPYQGAASTGYWSLFDINGDARPDLVVTAPASSSGGAPVFGNGGDAYWQIYLNNGAGFDSNPTRWDVPDDSMGGYGFNITAQSNAPNGNWSVLDINGDGLPDLVVTAPASSSGATIYGYGSNAYWQVFTNTGAGFSSSATSWNVPEDSMGGHGFYTLGYGYYPNGYWTVQDLTGDGLVDLVVTAPPNSAGTDVYGYGGDAYWRVFANTGSGFPEQSTNWDVPDETMGGSGFYTTSQSYWVEGYWSVTDLDGDARPDLVVSAPANSSGTSVFGNGGDAVWHKYTNTGAGFSSSPTDWDVPDEVGSGHGFYTFAQAYYPEGYWATTDINRDGLVDLVMCAGPTSTRVSVYLNGTDAYWRVFVNSGAGFSASASSWDVPDESVNGLGLYTMSQAYYAEGYWTTIDLDGDGGLDIVMSAPATSTTTGVYRNGDDAYWKFYRGE